MIHRLNYIERIPDVLQLSDRRIPVHLRLPAACCVTGHPRNHLGCRPHLCHYKAGRTGLVQLVPVRTPEPNRSPEIFERCFSFQGLRRKSYEVCYRKGKIDSGPHNE